MGHGISSEAVTVLIKLFASRFTLPEGTSHSSRVVRVGQSEYFPRACDRLSTLLA